MARLYPELVAKMGAFVEASYVESKDWPMPQNQANGEQKMKSLYSVLIVLANLFILPAGSLSVESRLWRDFVKGDRTQLPDFSYAGYARGEARVPDVDWPAYNVVDYGADPGPDTPGSKDLDAIKKAIKSVPACEGGVIFFPEGTYDIGNSSSQSADNVIHYRRGRIVWRGDGRDKSIIHMKKTTATANTYTPKIMVSVFGGAASDENLDTRITDITSDAKLNDFSIDVKSTSGLSVNQWVKIYMLAGENEFYDYLLPYSKLTSWTTGARFSERHQIKSIDGNTLTFYEPILIPYIRHTEGADGTKWGIYTFRHHEMIGFENLCFRGNWGPDDPYWPYVHHDPASSEYDDSGWTALSINDAVNSWVRRCRFTNYTNSQFIRNCAFFSYLENEIDQDTYSGDNWYGHHGIFLISCNYCIAGASATTAKLTHGPTNNGYLQGNGGNVIWRHKYHPSTGPDSHSYSIWSTLYDLTEGGLKRRASTGAGYGRPNHLKHFVLWNHKNTDPARGDRLSSSDPTSEYDEYAFWDHRRSFYYVTPTVVGIHGQPVNFLTSGIGRVETLEYNGRDDVRPRSLYEAQLELRLGYLPQWIRELRKDGKL